MAQIIDLFTGIRDTLSAPASYFTGGEVKLPRSEVVVTNPVSFPSPTRPAFVGPPDPQWLPGEFDARAAATKASENANKPGTDWGAVFSSVIGGAGQVYSTIQEQKLEQARQRTARVLAAQQAQQGWMPQGGMSIGKVALIGVAVLGIGALAYAVAKKKGR